MEANQVEPQESLSSPLPCLVPSHFLLLRLGWWGWRSPDIAGSPSPSSACLPTTALQPLGIVNTPSLTLGLWPLYPHKVRLDRI